MTFILPARISPLWTMTAALLLFFAQISLGTSFLFAIGVFLYINVSIWAVNILGGLRTLSGFVVFAISLKFVLLSQIVKTVKFQNAGSFLESPETTIGVLLLSMIATLCAAAISMPFFQKTPVFKPITSPRKLQFLTWFFLIFCGGIFTAIQVVGPDPATLVAKFGGFLGVMRFLTRFTILAVVTATASAIITSGGKKSISLLSALTIGVNFFIGILLTSKFGMLSPFFAYGLTCLAFQYRFKLINIFGVLLLVVVSFQLIFPFAQYVRGFTGGLSFTHRFEITTDEFVSIITDPVRRNRVSGTVNELWADRLWTLYYGEPIPFIDRFSMIKQADLLITATDSYGNLGMTTTSHGLSMILPRFINPDKPVYGTSNLLAHQVGLLAYSNTKTQVAFGMAPDSYASFGWAGVFVIPFLIMSAFFLLYNKLAGIIGYNIWSIFLAIRFQHTMVEDSISSLIVELTILTFALYFLYYTYVFISQILYPSIETRQTHY